MEKIRRFLGFFALLFVALFVGDAWSAGYTCPEYKRYTSCNSGYYFLTVLGGDTGNCMECPSPGTKSDGGTSGISGCYIPSGTTGSDGSGSYTYSGNCYY